ncbi:transcription elongation factor TFIIS [Coemansia sp. RSA 552]|nr:transcription elongation factor TFIIS [Coemansia sp. RSA 552]
MSEVANRQSELKTLCRSLGEAQDADNRPELRKILSKLAAVSVDEKLLRATGAGQVVGKLRNNDDPAIATLARKVVHKWKKDVLATNSRTGSPASGAKSASRPHTPQPGLRDASHSQPPQKQQAQARQDADSRSAKPEGAGSRPSANGSPASKSSAASAATLTPSATGGGSALRTAALDGAQISSTGDSVRDKCAELLYNSMASDSNADMELLARRAADIERIEFGKAGAISPTYRTRVRSLCHNLRDKKNPDLRANVVDGSISVDRFCSMTSEEMASKELQKQIEEMRKENLFKVKAAGRTEAATDQFKCGRCKQRKCSYYQMQTRSADEPMTTFVTCTVCDNRWKFC